MSTTEAMRTLRDVVTALGSREWAWQPDARPDVPGIWHLTYAGPDAELPTGIAAVGEVLSHEALAIQALSPKNLQRLVQAHWLQLGVQQHVQLALEAVRRIRGSDDVESDSDVDWDLRAAMGHLEASAALLAEAVAPLGLTPQQLRSKRVLDPLPGRGGNANDVFGV